MRRFLQLSGEVVSGLGERGNKIVLAPNLNFQNGNSPRDIHVWFFAHGSGWRLRGHLGCEFSGAGGLGCCICEVDSETCAFRNYHVVYCWVELRVIRTGSRVAVLWNIRAPVVRHLFVLSVSSFLRFAPIFFSNDVTECSNRSTHRVTRTRYWH